MYPAPLLISLHTPAIGSVLQYRKVVWQRAASGSTFATKQCEVINQLPWCVEELNTFQINYRIINHYAIFLASD